MRPYLNPEELDDANARKYVKDVRKGISYSRFNQISERLPLVMEDWATYLHVSERTIQRYAKEKKSFGALQSEKILQIVLLFAKGREVFGREEAFNTWMDTINVALGDIKPKELLDSSFGISLVNDELGRIEYGIPA